MKYFFPLSVFLILFVSIVTRFVYQNYYPGVYITYDTGSYYSLAQGIVRNPKDFFNHFRTPVYPLVIAGCFSPFGQLSQQLHSDGDLEGFRCMIGFQQFFATLSTIVLFVVLYRVTKKRWMSFFVSMSIVIHPFIIPWERLILTESLSISWTILFFCVSLLLWKRPTFVVYILFLLSSFVGVLLRPSILPVPAAVSFVIFSFQPNGYLRIPGREALLRWIVVTAAYVLGIMIYILGNYYVHGIKTFQIVSSFNIIGRFMVHDIPVTGPQHPIGDVLAYDLLTGGERNPYSFLDFSYPQYSGDIPYLTSFESYTRTLLFDHLLEYILTIPKDFPNAVVPNYPEVKSFQNRQPGQSLFTLGQQFISFITVIQYFSPILYPIIILKKNLSPTLQFLGVYAFALIVTILLGNIFFAYIDYSRLVSTNLPLLCIYTGWLIVALQQRNKT